MSENSIRYFSGWWAILFIFLSFNLIPIPFAILISSLGDWVYQNPVVVDMNYLGEVTMHPIADNLVSIFSMTALLGFVLWRTTARNIPISRSFRYSIPGLPSKGYEGGSRNVGAFSKIVNSIFNPADFLYNLFGKNPRQLNKLKQMKDDYRIRELLASKFDRETLKELLQVEKVDIDEILRNCNYSDNFILSANDLQILDAISGCYEEFKVINRK